MKRLSVGSGIKRGHKKGWTNIDIDPIAEPDILGDINDELKKLENNSVDEIVSCHFIEHIELNELKLYLQLCYNKLKVGGRFETEFPDLKARCKRVAAGEDKVIWGIYGDWSRPFYGHKYGYTEASFRKMIESLGFTVMKIEGSKSNHNDSVCITATK